MLFMVVPSNWTRGIRPKLMRRKFYLNVRKNFLSVGDCVLEQIAQSLWNLSYWNLYKSHLDPLLCNVL